MPSQSCDCVVKWQRAGRPSVGTPGAPLTIVRSDAATRLLHPRKLS